jgi:endonuclease YncB( thermonuclease family)
MRLRLTVVLIGALGAGAAFAHEGALDKQGCHTNRKTNDYHCHRGEQAEGKELRGQVAVVDGDSLRMRGTEIRLYGVDAVEGDQSCRRESGERWACGRHAAQALREFIARQAVTCVDRGKDSYGRTLGTCSTESGEINDWLVRQGWAVAYTRYSRRYVPAEAEAREAKRNIWSGSFTKPERYRRDKRN